MRLPGCLLLHLFFLAGLPFTYAQPPLRFDHVTSENGLPQNSILGIAKDKYGFMWFGTWSGLCRYDGYRFKVYRYDPKNPRSISNNRIHNIAIDRKQELWAQTFDPSFVCRYNYATDDFERVPVDQVSKEFLSRLSRWNHYHRVAYRFGDRRWTIDPRKKALLQASPPKGRVVRITPDPFDKWSINDPYVSDIYIDDQRIFWVGTENGGLNKANLEAKPFSYFYHSPDDPNSITDNNVSALTEDRRGNLWVGNRNRGITIIRPGKPSLRLSHTSDPRSLADNEVRTILCDSRGLVWIGTKTGLDNYDAQGKITHFQMLNLRGTAVYGAVEDHNKNLWFATWKGLYKFDVRANRMMHFAPAETVGQRQCKVIMQDSRRLLWVGTEGGGLTALREVSPGKLLVVSRLHHDPGSANSLSDDRIYSLLEDTEHKIWIGTGNGLELYDPGSKKIEHFSLSPTGLANATIAGILQDNRGAIWVSHKGGLSKIERKNQTIQNYTQQDGLQSNEFSDGAVYKSRTKNIFYAGGPNGYNVFCPDSIKPGRLLPKVVLTELQVLSKTVNVNDEVNGRVLLKRPLYLTKALALNYNDKSISIEFSGLHYANPAGNRYAYRLEGFDKEWIYTDASRRVATYSNLEPGNYVFKVKASNSDGLWNPEPKLLAISMAAPPWASTWAYLLYAILVAGLLYAYYRFTIRLARLKGRLVYESMLHQKDLDLQESKLQFFTNISHEIKTPLSLILAPVEILLSKTGSDAESKKQLHTMKRNGDRLLRLINQLLDLRRFETGHEKLLPGRIELVSFSRNILGSFEQWALQEQVDLRFSSGPGALWAQVDSDKLEKVLFNLLSNALRFAARPGIVELDVSTDNATAQVIIEVSDNGDGVPVSDLERIFKPFERGSSGNAGGTGLGLAYSRALVELHGGTLNVRNAVNGDGFGRTVFTVRLPNDAVTDNAAFKVSPKPLVEAPAEPLPETTGKDRGKPVLLLIEDNDEMRRYLCDFFEGTYSVVEATNGAEGLHAATIHMPDIVVSDVMMPGIDGIELCSRLKNDILTSHIPIILLTARAPLELQIEGIATGADDYLVKPFSLNLLALKIHNLLLLRKKLREQFKSKMVIEPSMIQPVSADDRLIKKILTYVEERIADRELTLDAIADVVGMSRTHLYRKMKALTGLTMAELLKDIRLKRACQLLASRKFNVNEVSYMTGFSDTDYFRKCFKAAFGMSPSDYVKSAEMN